MDVIQKYDSLLVSFIKATTSRFIETRLGKLFLGLPLVGPLTLIPTVWEAWFASNIDALRTLTWPTMMIVNFSVLVALCYNGDWRIRLSMVMWNLVIFPVFLATVFR